MSVLQNLNRFFEGNHAPSRSPRTLKIATQIDVRPLFVTAVGSTLLFPSRSISLYDSATVSIVCAADKSTAAALARRRRLRSALPMFFRGGRCQSSCVRRARLLAFSPFDIFCSATVTSVEIRDQDCIRIEGGKVCLMAAEKSDSSPSPSTCSASRLTTTLKMGIDGQNLLDVRAPCGVSRCGAD